jgi:hypothetical protein
LGGSTGKAQEAENEPETMMHSNASFTLAVCAEMIFNDLPLRRALRGRNTPQLFQRPTSFPGVVQNGPKLSGFVQDV